MRSINGRFKQTCLKYLLASAVIWVLLLPRAAVADGINGIAELSYTHLVTRTEDSSGTATRQKTDDFFQRYNISLTRSIFPHLRMNARGIFESEVAKSTSDTQETKTTLTKISPYIDFLLSTPFYTADVGYHRTEEKQSTTGSAPTVATRESYNASLGLRPEGLPTLTMLLLRSYTYNEDRSTQNNVTDNIFLSSKYSLFKGLDLAYQAIYNDSRDKVTGLETTNLTQNGRATYATQFLRNRVLLSTNYNITQRQTITSNTGTGEVLFQIFPLASLSGIDTPPDTPSDDTLLPAISGINIGLTLTGDTRTRNVGLDLGAETEVNTLHVFVNQDISTIASLFSWEVYISSDTTDRKHWTLWQSASSFPFSLFDRRFAITFPTVSTRFIKVVTKPLTPPVVAPGVSDVYNILVTELQAFISKPADTVRGKTVQISQTYDMNVRARLLDSPAVFYDFYYWYTRTDLPAASRYILSNGLSVDHRFNRFFSGGARIAREDGKESSGRKVAYVYSALLRAVPMRTLNHSLVFSGRNEEKEEGKSDTHSLFLTNLIELYPGITINLSGGLNFSTSETGQKSDSTIMNVGAQIIPHKTMNINFNYSDTVTKQSGGGVEETTTYTKKGDLSLSYNPFKAVSLFTSLSIISEKDMEDKVIHNYGTTWAPFPDGALQFNFFYNESLKSENNGKDTSISPTLRWNISKSIFLNLSYQIVKSESSTQMSRSRNFNTNLNVLF
ncbi:MAG: hypothetical protein K8I29_01475 [Alphaproteobacteria bacterium]|uniref:Uncharacterized protein n=1 Tax=Candidatus Nitrobium versatile TaxID=2884831 RepID=A0A953J9Z0_9BACT|nr:hypothetical protein [Candidatus Nitrobium versatile]